MVMGYALCVRFSCMVNSRWQGSADVWGFEAAGQCNLRIVFVFPSLRPCRLTKPTVHLKMIRGYCRRLGCVYDIATKSFVKSFGIL